MKKLALIAVVALAVSILPQSTYSQASFTEIAVHGETEDGEFVFDVSHPEYKNKFLKVTAIEGDNYIMTSESNDAERYVYLVNRTYQSQVIEPGHESLVIIDPTNDNKLITIIPVDNN